MSLHSVPNSGEVRTRRVLGWLSALAALALVALMLHVGDPQSADWWPVAIPMGLWVIGPAIFPWVIARLRPQPIVAASMLAFLIVSSAVSATAYIDAFFRSTSSTAALILIFMPLLQWIALAMVAVVVIVVAVRTGRKTS